MDQIVDLASDDRDSAIAIPEIRGAGHEFVELKRRIGARSVIAPVADELAVGEVTLRDMRTSDERRVSRADVTQTVTELLHGSTEED